MAVEAKEAPVTETGTVEKTETEKPKTIAESASAAKAAARAALFNKGGKESAKSGDKLPPETLAKKDPPALEVVKDAKETVAKKPDAYTERMATLAELDRRVGSERDKLTSERTAFETERTAMKADADVGKVIREARKAKDFVRAAREAVGEEGWDQLFWELAEQIKNEDDPDFKTRKIVKDSLEEERARVARAAAEAEAAKPKPQTADDMRETALAVYVEEGAALLKEPKFADRWPAIRSKGKLSPAFFRATVEQLNDIRGTAPDVDDVLDHIDRLYGGASKSAHTPDSVEESKGGPITPGASDLRAGVTSTSTEAETKKLSVADAKAAAKAKMRAALAQKHK